MSSAPEDTQASALGEDDEISLIDLLIVLAKHKMLVLGLPLLAGVAALIIALLLPKIYTGSVRILPPQQKDSSAAAMLGAITGVAGGASAAAGQALGIRNPNDLYAGVLNGRTVADRLIERFSLKDLYDADTMVGARIQLAGRTRIIAGRDGLITVEVDDRDPERAADLANAYIEELDRLMQGLAVTEASQRRLFFEKQLTNAQDQLIASEMALRQTIDAKGISGVEAHSRAVVGTTEQLRAQIAVKEIQLHAMRAFATDRNPDAVRLRQEVASMKAELAKLEGGRSDADPTESPAGLESLRKLREVKFLEFTVELLTKQYEIAKIDEAKDAVLIQVVDKAIPPDYKSKPKRALIVIVATVVFGLIAVLWAFLLEGLEKARRDPTSGARLDFLRRNLRWRQ